MNSFGDIRFVFLRVDGITLITLITRLQKRAQSPMKDKKVTTSQTRAKWRKSSGFKLNQGSLSVGCGGGFDCSEFGIDFRSNWWQNLTKSE